MTPLVSKDFLFHFSDRLQGSFEFGSQERLDWIAECKYGIHGSSCIHQEVFVSFEFQIAFITLCFNPNLGMTCFEKQIWFAKFPQTNSDL